MKTSSLRVEGLTVDRLLQEAIGRDVVFLTQGGETRFAVMPADEGDQEVIALRSNAEFMAYLADCKRRTLSGASTSLAEVRNQFEAGSTSRTARGPASLKRRSRGKKRRNPTHRASGS
jgi:hypothetical protein